METNQEQNVNAQEWAKNSLEILQKSQKIMEVLWQKLPQQSFFYDIGTWQQALNSYTKLAQGLLNNPQKAWEQQWEWWHEYANLWQQFTCAWWGKPSISEPAAITPTDDKRFKNEEWQNNPVFAYLKQAYLLTAKYLMEMVYHAEGFDPKASRQLRFYTQQFIDALSPSNFVLTNPQVLNTTIQSAGANLVKGLDHMLHDLQENEGRFKISMTDMRAFQIGRDIATTPGKVVYQNRLIQLIQYTPITKDVYETPLLMIPPWINKYYILDMRADNSFVRSALEQGHTVFMVSWVNPDASYANVTFDEYMTDGTLAAIDVVRAITNQEKINVLAYCIGGTLMSCTLAYLADKKQNVINSATFLATLMDFTDPGDIGVFIDEEQVQGIEEHMQEKGYLDGRDMALTFNTLRANDLIWSYFVNNYLEGKEPFAFDLLYWNNDATNLAAKAHEFYLREFYLNNKLREPHGVTLNHVAIDLHDIKVPVYMVATEQDHIAPWRSVYSGLKLLGSKSKFVLGGSGHIAGIINPPIKEKYGYRVQENPKQDPNQWYAESIINKGSWWVDWYNWLKQYAGKKVKPPTMGNKQYQPLMDAPGTYVVGTCTE
jgi:polyhydroxyalkanoate synthase